MEHVAHVAGDDLLLLRRVEAGPVERRLQAPEQRDQRLAARRRREQLAREGQARPAARLPPRVADEQHRLGEVERGKVRGDREGDDRVGERHLVVGEADPLAAEHHRGALALAGRELAHGLLGREDPLHLPALPRRGRQHVPAVGDGLGDAAVDRGRVQDVRRARGRLAHALLGPAVLRVDEAQLREAEIRHGTGGHADVLGELRLHQDHRRGDPGRQFGDLPRGNLGGVALCVSARHGGRLARRARTRRGPSDDAARMTARAFRRRKGRAMSRGDSGPGRPTGHPGQRPHGPCMPCAGTTREGIGPWRRSR